MISLFQYVNELCNPEFSSGSLQINSYNYIRCYFKEVLKQVQHFVENIGVEPMTSCVQGRRSSQLS